MEKDGMPTCGDCENFNGKYCDFEEFEGTVVFEDDSPKDKCNYKGFKKAEYKYRREYK